MKVFLAFPPHWCIHSPPLAPALLSSVLKDAGHEVEVRDLNLETFRILTSRKWLIHARDRAIEYLDKQPNVTELTQKERNRRSYIAGRMAAFPFILEQGEKSFRQIKEPDVFYDTEKLSHHKKIIDLTLQLALLTSYPTIFCIDTLNSPFSSFSTEQILKVCSSPEENPFIDLFQRHFIQEIIDSGCGLLGISINSHNQVIPGLTLARLAKTRNKELHVCVGGSFFTKMSEEINPKHFRWVDSFAVHEGEEAIVELCRRLGGDEEANLCNLIHLDSEGILIREQIRPLDNLDRFPDPDFSQYRFQDYSSPAPTVPVISSRGCYYARCSFCGSPSILIKKYASISPHRFAAMIKRIQDKYDAQYFVFMDEALSPAYLKKLTKEILNLKSSGELGDLHFTGEIRLERTFLEKGFIHDLRLAGFRKLLIGFESFNERIQKLICKRIDLQVGLRILERLIEQDISIHLFFIAGYPSETREEFESGFYNLLKENVIQKDPFLSFAFHEFELERGSAIYQNPEEYGIQNIIHDSENDLATHFEYLGVAPDAEERRDRSQQATIFMVRALNRLFLQNPYHTMFYMEHFRRHGLSHEELMERFTMSKGTVERDSAEIRSQDKLQAVGSIRYERVDETTHIFNPHTVDFGRLTDLDLEIYQLCLKRPSTLEEVVATLSKKEGPSVIHGGSILVSIQNLLSQNILTVYTNEEADDDKG